MNEQSKMLELQARTFCTELSGHEVLREYWEDLSLILKGSVARGNADQYSDIDFVFYCGKETWHRIVDGYHSRGLTQRSDGVFMPLPDWIGHYHFETYDTLQQYFSDRNYPQIWECTNVIILHDPAGKYAALLNAGMQSLFTDPLKAVKAKYLELQLTLDWLRHPLKRGDKVAVLLHCSKFIQTACQLCYLLDCKTFPHDKWIFQNIESTRLGARQKQQLEAYAGNIAGEEAIVPGLELDQYPQYKDAEAIVRAIAGAITDAHGEQPWVGEWYLYV